jgi:hypothetical protein
LVAAATYLRFASLGCVNPWLNVWPWPVFSCLQNRLNELGQNLAIEIREW